MSSATGTGATIGASNDRRCVSPVSSSTRSLYPIPVPSPRGIDASDGSVARMPVNRPKIASLQQPAVAARSSVCGSFRSSHFRAAAGAPGNIAPPLIRNTPSSTPERSHSSTSPPARPSNQDSAGRTGWKFSSVIQQPSPCPVMATESGGDPASRTASVTTAASVARMTSKSCSTAPLMPARSCINGMGRPCTASAFPDSSKIAALTTEVPASMPR